MLAAADATAAGLQGKQPPISARGQRDRKREELHTSTYIIGLEDVLESVPSTSASVCFLTT